jgi:predicted nucleic acid-binding Zn ribbon protein
MERLDRTATRAVRSILQDQPVGQAKIAFAWNIAAGPTLAAATSVTWRDDGILCVWAKTDEWRQEAQRARAVLFERITQLVGPGVVRDIKVLSPS